MTARRARPSSAIARSPVGQIAITDRWGATKYLRCGARHLPELASHHLDAGRGAAVLAQAVDGARPHALHAVGQDLRHGRPAVLEGQGSAHRARSDEHDAHRPPHARHLSVRQWRRQAGRHLPVLFLDERCPEDAAAAGRQAGAAGARRAEAHLSRRSISRATSSAIRSPCPGRPIPNFLGAFKGALPGHYRYNHRMYCQFMQDDMPPEREGHLPRRRRRVVDAGLGRGRGADRRSTRSGASCIIWVARRRRTIPVRATASRSSSPSTCRSETSFFSWPDGVCTNGRAVAS